jgi:hypothetical protein
MSQYFDDKEALFSSPTITQQGNHMVMSNIYKNTKVKYVNIDTRFNEDVHLYNGASFIYNLPQRISDVKSIAVRNLELPMTSYAFSSSKGNTFMKIIKKYINGMVADSNTLTIPDNNYSLESLKTSINSQLQDLGFANDISFNVSNSHSQFIRSVDNSFEYILQFAVDSKGIFDKFQIKSKLGWCLGFRELEYTLSSAQNTNSVSSEGPINIINFRYLFLVIDEFRQSNPNSFISPLHYSLINKNILARIVVDSNKYPYGTVLPANIFNGLLLSDTRTYSGKTDLQKFQIQLVDEWGKVVDLNYMEFSFCLEIQYE